MFEGATINMGHQHKVDQAHGSTLLHAPAKSLCVQKNPNTDSLQDSDKLSSLPQRCADPVPPSKLIQKCPRILLSLLEGCPTDPSDFCADTPTSRQSQLI